MRKVLRVFAWSSLIIAAVATSLLGYFVYTPNPEKPQLSGVLSHGSIEAGGLKRTYLIYAPRGLPKGAPLVLVMHGSDENSARIRIETGYDFERLADEHGFAVAYPDAYEGNWNACNIVGDYSANKLNIDDVAFLSALADKLANEIDVDPARTFATGVSRGGHMAYRLALEAPGRFRAVAAVAANVPIPENFKCKPSGGGTSSVLVMNGTADPLNPFKGGEVKLYGLFLGRGFVRSSHESAAYFAGLNGIIAAPETHTTPVADGFALEQVRWHSATAEIELDAIHGGGHVMPQPYWRAPRLLGPTPREPDGPASIWSFFARQPQR